MSWVRSILTNKQATTNDISQQSRNDALPDIQTDRDTRGIEPDTKGNESHVGDNVIKSKGNKGKNRPPNTHDLGSEVPSLQPKETSQTDEPVTSNASEEDLAEVGGNLFLGRKGHDGRLEWVGFEYTTI